MGAEYTVSVLIWIVCAFFAYFIANSRGAPNAGGWGLLGFFFFGPLGVLAAAIGAKGPGAARAAASLGAADELAKLAALRDSGTLTQAEFDRQKEALLTPASPPTSGRTPGQMIVWGIIGLLVILGIWLYSQI